LKAEKRFSQGLSFLGTYTWSKNISRDGDGFSLSYGAQDPTNLTLERALSVFDHRHIFALNYIYELPFGKGRASLSDLSGVGNAILGGWQINGIITARSGGPVNISIPRDIANIGPRAIGQRPNVSGDPNISNGTAGGWFDTSVFSEPAPYTFGNAGRNIVTGPHHQNWNLGLYKNFPIRENRDRIQFRVEFFNVWNLVNLAQPEGNFDSPNFGRISSSLPARQIQFGLKYNF
jgi:hypothetical protein